MTRVHDGLVNMVSGLGTARDKGATAAYSVSLMSEAELVAAYTESAIAARVVTMPAEDAVREWREWSAENVEVSVIEAEEHRVGLQLKLLEANTLARLLGTAVIVIGADGADMSKPLLPDRVKRGGLQYLEVLTTRHIQPGPLSEKLGVGTFGKPEYWTLNADGQSLRVHPSRLVVLYGSEPLPHVGANMRTGEGMSVLQGAMPAIKRVDELAANINSLSYEAKVDVFGIPDLMQNLASRGDDYANEVIKRMTLAATTKGINGMLIRDGLETYDQKSASFGTLDTLLDKFMTLGSAVAGIPMTLLFGVSPGGLNATGASDIRAYYDRVRVQQTMKLGPAMAVLDEVLIRSALGSRPDDVHYNWRPLWQATALEKAQVGKLIVDTMAVLDAMEIMPAESIQAATVSALVECGAYPGLEAAAMDDVGEDDDMEDDPKPVTDAAPRTLYVRRDVLNGDEILAWAKSQGFANTLTADDLHVTIAYSKAPVDWMKMGQAWQSKLDIAEGGPRMMEQFGEARVLLIASDDLNWRHNHFKEMGATWDYAEYHPHITISYDPKSPDLAGVEPYRGKIVLGHEVFEEVNTEWNPK